MMARSPTLDRTAEATSAAAQPTPAGPRVQPPARHAYTRLCAALSKGSLVLAVVLLLAIVVCVQTQVVGRYLLNDTPTWAEALALQLVLYVTALGVAVGVRDAGHIGLESLAVLLPDAWRLKLEILIHALVALFGAIMAFSGWTWTTLKWRQLDPMLHVPQGLDYLALVVAGVLIVLFSIEHVVALLRGEDVLPAWH
jgi:TRAP-type C4-dicarboxylate transport system permease small subunit